MFYGEALDHLKGHADELNFEFTPEIILFYFEIAFKNVGCVMLPDSSIKGCIFHLTQAVYKHALNININTTMFV